MNERLAAAMAKLPLVAILRGVTPGEAPAIAEALLAEDFDLIEIPLISDPFASIAAVRGIAPARAFVGAGTVLTTSEVDVVAQAGGDLIVTPNTNVDVIARAKTLGLVCLPGAAAAHGGLCGARGRRRRSEGVSGGDDFAGGREGLARRVAKGTARSYPWVGSRRTTWGLT